MNEMKTEKKKTKNQGNQRNVLERSINPLNSHTTDKKKREKIQMNDIKNKNHYWLLCMEAMKIISEYLTILCKPIYQHICSS